MQLPTEHQFHEGRRDNVVDKASQGSVVVHKIRYKTLVSVSEGSILNIYKKRKKIKRP